MNPVNVAAKPLYKIAVRFYSKSYRLLFITRLRSGYLCEPRSALVRLWRGLAC